MKKNICVILVIVCLCISGCTSVGMTKNDDIVVTNYGKVSGIEQDGVLKYLGVPFAKPPIGDLRFEPPQKMDKWEGVLECTEVGPSAVQGEGILDEGLSTGEDCLYLNIWAPKNGEKLPVYVFIHGGAYAQGSPSKPKYDGTAFAKDGVIQVNISYRLNALGFLASEEMEDSNVGAVGILDQIAALEWINQNIEAFGGDKNNITIGGESAGSFSVSTLMSITNAKGLFQKAILESGNIINQPYVAPASSGDLEQAKRTTKQFMEKLGVQNLQQLREIDAQLLADESAFEFNMLNQNQYLFWPTFNDTLIPSDPYHSLINGEISTVPILAGFNTDEGTLFFPEVVSEEEYIAYVQDTFGEHADAILQRFPVDEEHSATQRAQYLLKMVCIRMGTEVFADEFSTKGQDVYYYNFNYASLELTTEQQGASHGMEMPFIFDTWPNELSEEAQTLQQDIHNRWVNFVTNGDPNIGKPVGTAWEKYTANDRKTLIIDENTRMDDIPNEEDMLFFRELLITG